MNKLTLEERKKRLDEKILNLNKKKNDKRTINNKLIINHIVDNTEINCKINNVRIQNKEKKNNYYIGVVTVTNRKNCGINIINNFKRQIVDGKKLFIILNNDDMNTIYYDELCKINKIKNYIIHQIDEEKNLGYCLNISLLLLFKNNCKYFTKFDDDDYYGKYYLDEMINSLYISNADIIGKKKIIYYIVEKNEFFILKKENNEFNRFVNNISGATITFDLSIITKYDIIFDQLLQFGVDKKFIKDINDKGGKIYSTSYNNFIVIRHDDITKHTWKKKFKNNELLKIEKDNNLINNLKEHII